MTHKGFKRLVDRWIELGIEHSQDTAIGEAMQKAGADTRLMVISDHGFARFDRAVHLNTFLMQQGFLALDDPANAGDAELFAHVDWTRSVAYAIGLNGIYVNLEGREDGGIVPPAGKRKVLDQIAARLQEFTDPVSGEHVHHPNKAGSPQSGLGHPAAQCLLAHRYLVQPVQILAGQRGPESPVHRGGKDGDGSLFQFRSQLPIAFSPAQLMDYGLVSFPPQLPQESPYLPLCDADLLGGLLLRDHFLLRPLEGIQPVSLGLVHQ